ncbi:hypothetical protein C5167_022131 [Papaver somniferum]|uniref:Uncharacterized protein n=1 Tax=Papaver somniferum TaxID=3469 RepID=A0A4Y7JK07_PAPSO|nr:hypothetical protein C5167_022131 [Papaver somniferum]
MADQVIKRNRMSIAKASTYLEKQDLYGKNKRAWKQALTLKESCRVRKHILMMMEKIIGNLDSNSSNVSIRELFEG